jgi:hypothetical protein
MRYLRTNTAARITVGPFLDKTDGITPETGLTVTACHLTLMADIANVPTLQLDANATASAGNNDMVHVTNDDAGFYDLELTAANVNFLGRGLLSINDVATHCPVFHEFMILPAVVYDAMVLGTDLFQTDVTQLLGTAWLTPQTAGTPDVNCVQWNELATVALPLIPTTAGRTLDVSTGGEAGLDWANVGSPTTTVGLSGTTVKTATDVETDTANIQGRIPSALGTNGNMKADLIDISSTAIATPNTAGVLIVDVGYVDGTVVDTATPVEANVTQLGGVVQSLTDLKDFVDTGYDPVAHKVQGVVLTDTATNLTNAPTNGDLTATMKTSVTTAATSATPVAASVSGNVAGNVTGSVGSLATQAKTDVNAEVVDALATDTYAEPGQGAPATTTSLAAKLNYLYKNWRNKKTQTATEWSLFADDATTVDQKATVSDDATTATKTEIATGA